MEKGTIEGNNPNLTEMNSDFLYHLDIRITDTNDTSDIQEKFGDVRFVCMGGTKRRMAEMARYICSVITPDKCIGEFVDMSEKGHRYDMYKVGPVLCCSHGTGMPSVSVALHELIKLVMYARCKNPIFIRVGTCGGLGVDTGTVVVTKSAYNGYLRNEYEIAILGQRVVRPAVFDEAVYRNIAKCRESADKFDTICADTMSTDCFFEGQARLDGAVCSYSLKEKMEFLRRCHDFGIRNIEMEALVFAALTTQAGFRSACVCVSLVNRLKGDQIIHTPEELKEFEQRPLIIVGRYIKRCLSQVLA